MDAVPPLALEDSPALRDSLSDSDDDESSSASEASPSANAVRASGKRMARALYAWNESVGAAPGDLNFEVDDEIEVISDAPGDGWMTGATADAQGMFPSNYVEELASAESEQQGVSMEELVKKQVAEQLALATASGPEEIPAAGDDGASKEPARSCAECGKASHVRPTLQ